MNPRTLEDTTVERKADLQLVVPKFAQQIGTPNFAESNVPVFEYNHRKIINSVVVALEKQGAPNDLKAHCVSALKVLFYRAEFGNVKDQIAAYAEYDEDGVFLHIRNWGNDRVLHLVLAEREGSFELVISKVEGDKISIGKVLKKPFYGVQEILWVLGLAA